MSTFDQSMADLKYQLEKQRAILGFNYQDGDGWFASQDANPTALEKTYLICADLLIGAHETEPDGLANLIVWPVVYLYRHSVELCLKKLIDHAGVDISHLKGIKRHGIYELYQALSAKLESIELDLEKNGQIIDLIPDENVFNAIMQFHAISPRSDELRFEDGGLIGGEGHSLFLNFVNAQTHAHSVSRYVEQTERRLNLLLSGREEREAI